MVVFHFQFRIRYNHSIAQNSNWNMFFIVNTLKIINCNGTMLQHQNEHYFTIIWLQINLKGMVVFHFQFKIRYNHSIAQNLSWKMFFIVNTLNINNCNGTMLEHQNEHYFTIIWLQTILKGMLVFNFQFKIRYNHSLAQNSSWKMFFIVNTLKITIVMELCWNSKMSITLPS